MIQDPGPCSSLIHSWNVSIIGFKISCLLLMEHRQLSPLPTEQAVKIWLRETYITLTIPKAIIFSQRSYTKRFILRVCFSPFFLIRTLHFWTTSWWFFPLRKTPQATASLTSSVLSGTSVFPIFLKYYNAFHVLYTFRESHLFLFFLVYLLVMVLSSICKSLGLESAFLPRIIGKVCDLCCLCPSWPEAVFILKKKQKRKMVKAAGTWYPYVHSNIPDWVKYYIVFHIKTFY